MPGIKLMGPVQNELFKHRYFYLILAVVILMMGVTLHSGKQGADGNEYLRWTHSFVFDQDIHLLNNVEVIGGSYRLTPTGYVFERVNIGPALMWAPFYAISSFFLPGPAKPAIRFYPEVQFLWVNFSSWVYTILGVILTGGALRRQFPTRIWVEAVVVIVLGTPVLFYMVTFSLSSHPASIFLGALLLYLWLSHQKKYPVLHNLTMGIVCGWLMSIASYNVALLVLPALDLLKDYLDDRNWRTFLKHGLAIGLGGLMGFAPQMIVWWFLFGGPLNSPYSGQMVWSESYYLETLFSNFHGLFFYAPVLLLVAPGLWWWAHKNLWRALSIGLCWIVFTYIISISTGWWGGSSFGNRYFLTLTPFFTLGLAAFLQKADKKWKFAFIIPAVLWTVGLYLQFLYGVRLTSDSIVFPIRDILFGQIKVFTHLFNILPAFTANQPWSAVPLMTLPVMIFILTIASRMMYEGVIVKQNRYFIQISLMITGIGPGIILFVGLAGFRGETIKADLANQGFYEQDHVVVSTDIRETASDLVNRAKYHEQIGKPDKAITDLRSASESWKLENVGSPTRLYLGPKDLLSENLSLDLHLDYPGNSRLVGYKILQADRHQISGE
ncbi:MAG: hypothetical protein AB1801_14980, partial [Chloroflexota bacterium]